MSSRLGSKVRVIGWINDLAHFHHLVSLSLSDNHLDQFPVSLCAVHTLQVCDTLEVSLWSSDHTLLLRDY